MINACLSLNDTLQYGDQSLIDVWKANPESRLWLNILASDPQQDRELLLSLECHELAVQDALRSRHPPKLEHFDNQCFLLYKGFASCDEQLNIEMFQIAFFVNERLLISYRHGESVGINRCWSDNKLSEWLRSPVKLVSRILNESGRVYLEAILKTEKDLGDLEESMLVQPDDRLMQSLINYKTQLRKLLRVFTYHERLIQEILGDHTPHIPMENPDFRHSFQDVGDKFERLRSLCALYYDLCGDLIEGYISLSSHRLNRTMQVLTVITAIFIPLGLMAGIYGMNFENMPELHSRHGYFYLLGAMVTTAVGLLVLFRVKKWI